MGFNSAFKGLMSYVDLTNISAFCYAGMYITKFVDGYCLLGYDVVQSRMYALRLQR